MSYDWLTGAYTGNDRILKAVGDKRLAEQIKDAIDNGEVEFILSKVDKYGNVNTYLLELEGKEVKVVRPWP